jgi:glycerol-3-phosphate acyltransferase PlsY
MPAPSFIALAALTGFAYLLGGVPFGLLLVKWLRSVDLRETGSGNIGATNARRAAGWAAGLATLFLDVLKGALPVALAGLAFPPKAGPVHEPALALAVCSAFLGHLFPVYLKFRTGGKGVATAAGGFLVISPLSLLIALAAFFAGAAASRRVSVGSLAAAAVLPAAVFLLEHSLFLSASAALVALLIILRHGENIRRLREGREPPFI